MHHCYRQIACGEMRRHRHAARCGWRSIEFGCPGSELHLRHVLTGRSEKIQYSVLVFQASETAPNGGGGLVPNKKISLLILTVALWPISTWPRKFMPLSMFSVPPLVRSKWTAATHTTDPTNSDCGAFRCRFHGAATGKVRIEKIGG